MEGRIGFSHVNVFPCSYDDEFPLLPNSWMKSKWIFQCLAPTLRSHTNPLTSFFNSRSRGGNQSKLPTFVLGCLDVAPLLSHCGEEGRLLLGSSIHASIVKNPELHLLEDGIAHRYALLVWNSLLCMYVRCGRRLRLVRQLFDEIPVRDSVSWNVMLSGSLKDGGFDEGFGVFKRVFEEGVCCFDKATVTTILSGCDRGELLCVAMMIHGVVFRGGFCRELTVSNSLITAYFKCGGCGLGRQVFEEMVERNVVSWTAVISGLMKNELYEDGLRFLMRMRSGPVEPNRLTYLSAITACSGLRALNDGKQLHGLVWKLGFHLNVCVESALMDMYLKCGCVEDAWKIFELAESLDEVSLTVILVGFSQNGFEEEAINMFVKMVKAGFEVDSTAVSAILGVFGTDTSLNFGQQIHSMTIKKGFDLNTFVCNGLMNMYSKCGDMEKAVKFFDLMPAHIKNSITWNTMIAAYARHGDGHRALKLYEEMRMHGIMPTDVTFLSLIHACSHIGLVEKGIEFVDSMEKCYGISPRAEHYACVVDMLGRAGLLSEAKIYIEKLPLKPDIQVWQALLGACSISGNSEVGKYAAEQLFLAAPDTPAPYILLANIYSAEGNWKERARTIKRMKEAGVAKETGISWIEIEKEVHSFVVEDRMHPQSESIYWVLAELFVFMAEEGYVPDKRFILYYLNQDVGD